MTWAPLPDGIRRHDCAGLGLTFEIWLTDRFGWCIPVLPIAPAGRHGNRRTYAVVIQTGALVRVGHGPHVLQQLTVRIRPSNLSRVRRYMDMNRAGLRAALARRAQLSAARRAAKPQESRR